MSLTETARVCDFIPHTALEGTTKYFQRQSAGQRHVYRRFRASSS
jgi:hypothetical protein